MKKKEVVIGEIYKAKINNKVQPVKITGISPYGGWTGRTLVSNRQVHIRSAVKLRSKLDEKDLLATERGQKEFHVIKRAMNISNVHFSEEAQYYIHAHYGAIYALPQECIEELLVLVDAILEGREFEGDFFKTWKNSKRNRTEIRLVKRI